MVSSSHLKPFTITLKGLDISKFIGDCNKICMFFPLVNKIEKEICT
jgi:hypothetical protein